MCATMVSKLIGVKIKKVWGTEYVVVDNDRYCLKYLWVDEGMQSSLHFHNHKDETFVVMIGKLRLQLNGAWYEFKECEQVRIHPGDRHRFSSATAGHCIVMEISTSHYDDDVCRIIPSGRITGRIAE